MEIIVRVVKQRQDVNTMDSSTTEKGIVCLSKYLYIRSLDTTNFRRKEIKLIDK